MPGITPSKQRGTPIAKLDGYSGTEQTYQTVVSWTVSEDARGELKEISMISDNHPKTEFKLTIAGTEQFTDQTIPAPLTLPFPANRDLAPGEAVVLEARSTDGTSIIVDGSITGAEY